MTAKNDQSMIICKLTASKKINSNRRASYTCLNNCPTQTRHGEIWYTVLKGKSYSDKSSPGFYSFKLKSNPRRGNGWKNIIRVLSNPQRYMEN